MIAFIEGSILLKHPEYVVIVANNIGYHIEIPLQTYYALGDINNQAKLHIQMLVREDSIRLFGFKSIREKQLFQLFISISRIGPKLALNILSGMDPDSLIQVIVSEDIRKLSTIPGIGKKTAERILFEIREKISSIDFIDDLNMQPINSLKSSSILEAASVLTNLGYRKSDIEEALQKIKNENIDLNNLQIIIKMALKALSGRLIDER
jgi:holliday junction DNA helicase RuvA